MFDAKNGFFHFVFANQNDDFYTSSFLKLKFIPFLRYQIRLAGRYYRYVYLFREKELHESGEYYLEYIGEHARSASAQEVTPLRNSLFDSLKEMFTSKKNIGTEQADISEEEINNYVIFSEKIRKQQIREKLLHILNMMLHESNVLTVLPAELFYELMQEDASNLKTMLIELKRQRRANAMILFADANADMTMKYLIDPYYRYPRKKLNRPDERNIFTNKTLFPEFDEILNDAEPTSLCLFFEEMQNRFQDRMQVWTAVSYDCLYQAVFSFLLRKTEPEQFADNTDAQKITDVIWNWYHQPLMHDRYPDLPLENQKYEIREVLHLLESPEIRQKIIQTEIPTFKNTSPSVTLFRIEQETILPLLKQYHALLQKFPETQDIISQDEYESLLYMIADFEKPGFAQGNNVRSPIWYYFEDYQKDYEEYMHYLEQCKEPVGWDMGGIRLLYVLFALCYEDAHGTDMNHLRCQDLIYIGRYVLKNFKDSARDFPDDRQKASYQTSRQEELFRTGTKKEMSDYSYMTSTIIEERRKPHD